MKKRSVCWNITSRCNENCKFCYRIMTYIENDFERNKMILELLIKLKVNKITWTGGEALLYPHIEELMKISHMNGIKNNLITNGRELTKEKIDKIEPYLDYLTLSYDATDDRIHNLMGRGIEHGKHILDILEYVKNKDIKLKINTLVSKVNKKEIINIIQVIRNYNIERWKLFKFLPLRNNAIVNNQEFEVSEEKYEETVNAVKEKCGNHIKVISCKEEEIQDDYLLINPQGDFIITKDLNDQKIYDISDTDISKLKKYL